MRDQRGVTLPEILIGMTIMLIMAAAFASLLRYVTRAITLEGGRNSAQDDVRRGLMRMEEALAHASEVTLSSAAFVEFTCDIDQRTGYSPDADFDADGVPNYRDGDRDADAQLLMPATAQWRVGFNLEDDDDDGDGNVDLRRRIYLAGTDLWMDASVNGAAWGANATRLMADVSTFTLAYFGSKGNSLGSLIDLGADGTAGTADAGENDGVISSIEMDRVPAPTGMGNQNGLLDTASERRYVTSVRVKLGADRNKDGRTDYAVETDVYPPLLPLKSR